VGDAASVSAGWLHQLDNVTLEMYRTWNRADGRFVSSWDSTMQITDARERDFQACLPLLEQLWPGLSRKVAQEVQGLERLKAVFGRLTTGPNHRVMVARDGERVIALMDLTFRETIYHGGDTTIIEDLIVDEAHRGKGIGTRLVQLAEELARARGCRSIELSSDLHRREAHRFWQARGYQREAYQFCKELPATATGPADQA
jgi:GNAT superfamily N-acetyltransferase